jgi:hypothetical protein
VTRVEFFEQAPLRSRGEVFGTSPPPRAAGLYAWFFQPIAGVPLDGCLERDGRFLLYVGISPGPPSAAGKVSRENLYKRIRYHFGGVNRYTGNAYGSTLRKTLGCLLADQLGFRLTRVGSGNRLTFTHAGEVALSDWIEAHARVCWVENPRPWVEEDRIIANGHLPLNLRGNQHPFATTVKTVRKECRDAAKRRSLEPR